MPGRRSCSSSSWRGPGADLSLPRARRVHSSGIESPSSPSSPVANISGTPPDLQAFRRRRPAEERQRSPSPSSSSNNKKLSSGPLSSRDRFKDAKEKFLLLERERLEEQERQLQRRRNQEQPIAPTSSNSRGNPYPRHGSWSRSRDSDDELEDRPQRGGYYSPPVRDDFGTPEPEIILDDEEDVFERGYCGSPVRRDARRDSYNNHQEDVVPVRRHQEDVVQVRRHQEDVVPVRRRPEVQVYRGGRSHGNDDTRIVPPRGNEDPRNMSQRVMDDSRILPQPRYHSPPREEMLRRYPDEDRRRYRSPTRAPRRDQDFSPERRERFLSPTRNPRPQPRNSHSLEEEVDIPRYRAAPRHNLPTFNEDSNSDIPLERYRSPVRNPQPAPRHRIPEEDGIGSPEPQRRLPRANPFPISGEKKRRSMFDVLEEERRRNSNELAKEFKRRSYQDGGGSDLSGPNHSPNHTNGISNGRHAGYQELSEHERFPGLDRDTARLQHHNLGSSNGGHINPKKSSGPLPPDVVTSSRYRHSYAEPHHLMPSHTSSSHHHEMLHRTNSSVSSGRVGIAAVHPY